MGSVNKMRLSGLVLALVVVGVIVLAGAPAQARVRSCCLTNQDYNGVCKATPELGETCEHVLEYLNTVNTTGRTLCNNTEIRGGWALVKCSEAGKEPTGGDPPSRHRTSPMNDTPRKSRPTPTPAEGGASPTPAPTPAG